MTHFTIHFPLRCSFNLKTKPLLHMLEKGQMGEASRSGALSGSGAALAGVSDQQQDPAHCASIWSLATAAMAAGGWRRPSPAQSESSPLHSGPVQPTPRPMLEPIHFRVQSGPNSSLPRQSDGI